MILLQIHHMWYESNIIEECWDSIYRAIKSAPDVEVKIKICYNEQTYIEKPKHASPRDFFNKFETHRLMQEFNPELTIKTDKDPFYNIADWRRQVYDVDAKYTVWGESDCLMPRDFFAVLGALQVPVKHVVTFASRPMWDNSWDIVTHDKLQGFSKPCQCVTEHRENCIELLEAPLKYKDYISQKELDKFNDEAGDINIKQVPLKIDGSLVCISSGFDTPFIAPGMHFVREDTCFEEYCRKKEIIQICVTSRLKGHNYKHPNKRMGTDATRNDQVFKDYQTASIAAMSKFLAEL